MCAIAPCGLAGTPCALAGIYIGPLAGDDRIPDRVELNSGAKVEGRIVFEDASKLLLLTGGGEKTYDKKLVKASRSRARLHNDLFARWLALDAGAPGPILELARAAKQTDLLEDAACFASQVILLDPSNEEAHKLLGHRKRGSTWDLEFRKDRWLSFEKILPARGEWDESSDLESAHYLVRTNLGLRSAVEAALDLECFYRAFFELFGTELELREVVDPMTVELHGDKRSFAGLATGRTAYTDPVHNVVQIDASAGAGSEDLGSAGLSAGGSTPGSGSQRGSSGGSSAGGTRGGGAGPGSSGGGAAGSGTGGSAGSGAGGSAGSGGRGAAGPGGAAGSSVGGATRSDSAPGPNLHQLFHEATHQLVFAVTRFSFSGAGTVPGWLGEGLAEYVSSGMSGPPGKRRYSAGLIIPERFAVHAAAKAPYELSRVLTFESDDFVASTKADLKYAQAYTLVQFCMEGDGGKYKPAFLEFLRGAWKGRASAADFRKAMKISDKEFEKAWIAHVRATAR